MSNLSTLPKGDSAWLLRKAIERIIDQVSVLETNIGVSTSGNSANTQIIFNDDGTLRGDAGLVYNKTTDALTVGGLVTAGSATISGALTANGGATAIYMNSALFAGNSVNFTNLYCKSSGYVLYNSAGSFPVLNLDNTGVASFQDGAGGTRMTLNSTGLGIGRSPSYRFQASSGTKATTASIATVGGVTTTDTDDFGIFFRIKTDATGANRYAAITAFDNGSGNGARDLVLQDLGGNVGIGVTPSAWLSSLSALQIKGISGLYGAGSSEFGSVQNCFYNASSQWIYGTTAAAGKYAISSGVHQWFNAPSGTAGNAITFTQAMTLDASGNLSVGTTNATGVFGAVRSGFVATGANGAIGAKVDATGRTCLIAWNADTSGDNSFVQFFTEAALTARGSISYNRTGGLVAYNVTSDYRAKDIIGPVSNSGSLIDSLKVYLGKMKGATIARPMLIAHEAQEVAPYSVTGVKDEVDADGKEKYQQMDVSSFVPLLIAEIQSLRARVQTLEAR